MSLIDLTDNWVIPSLWLLADWSIRWGVLLVMLWIVLALRPPRQAQARYLLCAGALAAGILLPAVPRWATATYRWPSTNATGPIDPTESSAGPAHQMHSGLAASSAMHSGPALPEPRMAVPPPRSEYQARAAARPAPVLGGWRSSALAVAMIWAAAVALLSARMIGGRLWVARLKRGVIETDPASRSLLDTCRRELGLTRPVAIAGHRGVTSPVTLGGRAALIVVPPDWRDWSLGDRRACLLHELTHLVHRDDWVKLAEQMIRIPFFFHPMVHWLAARLDRERELICDETVVALGTDPVGYAELLLGLARRPGRLLALTRARSAGWLPFLDRSTVSERISKLLEANMNRNVTSSGLLPRRLLWSGVAAIAVAAGLGGLRFRMAEARGALPAGLPSGALQAASPVQNQPLKPQSIRGIVVDPAGKPVAGAAVVVGLKRRYGEGAADAPESARHIVESDASGHFECPSLEGSYTAYLYAYKAGFAPAASLHSHPEMAHRLPELRLTKPRPFQAKLIDREGNAIASADVQITMLATGPFESDGGMRVGICYEHVRWEFIRGSPLEAVYGAKTDREGNVVFPALREGGGIQFDVIDRAGRPSCRIDRKKLHGHRMLVDGGFASRAENGPAVVGVAPVSRISGRVFTKLPDVSPGGLRAFVQSTSLSRQTQEAEATIDADGRFTIDGLDEGPVNVFVWRRGRDDRWTYHAAQEVPLRSGETAEVTIELIRGVEVEGTVLAQGTKQPVPNVLVGGSEASRPQNYGAGGTATTDADGRYHFRLPPGKARLQVSGLPAGFTRLSDNGSSATLTLPEGVARFEAPPLEIAAAVTVKGRVLDASGSPVEGVRVVGTCVGGVCRPFPGKEAVTDAQGEFHLPSGSYNTVPIGEIARLLLRLRDGTEHEAAAVPAADGSVTIKLAAVQAKMPDVRGPRDVAPQDLAGIVVDTAGQPVEGVEVDAWTWYPGNETRTDRRGWFRLLNLGKDEKIEVEFRKPGYTPRLFLAEPTGTKDWVVVMGNKTYFEGRVLAPDGKPVEGALIRANRGPKRPQPGYMITDLWTETKSQTGGLYRLYAEADAYEIQVQVRGVGVARVPKQVLSTDEAKRLDIHLDHGVTFRAKVVDSVTKKPVAGVRLWHWQHRGVEGRSGDDGTVTIADMMPGRFAFQVDAPGYARWWSEHAATEWSRFKTNPNRGGWQRNFDQVDFDLSSGMDPVTITVEKAVTIMGRIVDPDGKPVAGATAAPALTGTGNSLTGDTRFSFETDKNGQFTMTLPASGARQYNLIAHDGKYDQWRHWANGVLPPFATKPGEVVRDVELKLTRPATVRGRVLDSSGRPIPNRQVRATSSDLLDNRYYVPTVTTAADGTFELKFIRPAEQLIQVYPFWLDPRQAPEGTSHTLTLKSGELREGVEFRVSADGR